MADSTGTEISESGPSSPESELERFSDVVFLVEGQKVFGLKSILIMMSPVFRAMFESDFKEKEAKEIDLPGKTFEAMKEFMEMVQIPFKAVTDDNISRIYPLAREYQVERLLQVCEQFLMAKPLSLDLYQVACNLDIEKVKDKCKNNVETIIRDTWTSIGRGQDPSVIVNEIDLRVSDQKHKYVMFKFLAENAIKVSHGLWKKYPKLNIFKEKLTSESNKEFYLKTCHENDNSHNSTRLSMCSKRMYGKLGRHTVGSMPCQCCTGCNEFRSLKAVVEPLSMLGFDLYKEL